MNQSQARRVRKRRATTGLLPGRKSRPISSAMLRPCSAGKREGMPVHRHLHDKMGSVYAFCTELDDWARTRNIRATQVNGTESPSNDINTSAQDPDAATAGVPNRSRFALPLIALAAMAALVIGAGLWLRKTEYF